MPISGSDIRTIDESYARLKLERERSEELKIELNQLSDAIESVAYRVQFDVDPFDFRSALMEVKAGEDS